MVDPEKYDVKDYVYIKIIEECKKYTEPEEKVNYLKYILYKWENNPPRLDLNGTLIPPFEVRIKNKIQRLEMGIEEREKGKMEWKGTKGEFGRFINEQYIEYSSNYGSLREASDVLFERYRFKWQGWTKEQCYDLAKKK